MIGDLRKSTGVTSKTFHLRLNLNKHRELEFHQNNGNFILASSDSDAFSNIGTAFLPPILDQTEPATN